MAGFFGLFRSKTKYVDDNTEASFDEPEAYFLSSDDANSLGKRSAVEKSQTKGKKPMPPTETKPATPKRSSTASDMDEFRKMARELKK